VASSSNLVGNTLAAQGDTTGALAAYREGLDITRALATKDPDNTQLQNDLSGSLQRVGDMLVIQRDPTGALAAYQEGLGVARALAAKDAHNTEWQRSLELSLNRTADMLAKTGDGDGALAAYREGLAIARTLADADTGTIRNGNATSRSASVASAMLQRRARISPARSRAFRKCSHAPSRSSSRTRRNGNTTCRRVLGCLASCWCLRAIRSGHARPSRNRATLPESWRSSFRTARRRRASSRSFSTSAARFRARETGRAARRPKRSRSGKARAGEQAYAQSEGLARYGALLARQAAVTGYFWLSTSMALRTL
jgi:predicted negative regulator of RcsB-dependent stress response